MDSAIVCNSSALRSLIVVICFLQKHFFSKKGYHPLKLIFGLWGWDAVFMHAQLLDAKDTNHTEESKYMQ